MKKKLTVEIWIDSDCENPCDNDGWKLYSFSKKHSSFKHPENFIRSFRRGEDPQPANIGIRSKLKAGTAFLLSYFEHGDSLWMLKDSHEWQRLPDKMWDGTRIAGILVWEGELDHLGPKTMEDRRKDAAGFVENYTAWSNGFTYGFTITEESGEEVQMPFGGFLDVDYMFSEIQTHTVDAEVDVTGDAGWLAEYHNVVKPVEADLALTT